MAPLLQMRHSLRAIPLVSGFILAVLLHQPPHVATQRVEAPVRDGYGSALAPSGCTMDLGRKDLAPVFTSCRSSFSLVKPRIQKEIYRTMLKLPANRHGGH